MAYSLYGWSLANQAKKKKALPPRRPSKTFFPSTSTARGKFGGGAHGTISTNTPNASDSWTSDYPSYNDPYGGLLQQLAAIRDQQIAQIKGDLAGRQSAITSLYNNQIPIVKQAYDQASGQAKNVNDAVAKQLGLEGQTASSDLLSKLGLIGAPGGSVEDAQNKLNSYYSGLGGANYAMDSGDVQRLIGAGAEAQDYLAKQPGIVNQQLASQAEQDIADLMSQYSSQYADLTSQQQSALNDYNMSKFQYDTQQKADAYQKKQDAITLYWNNYWKNRDDLERRWEVQQGLGQKNAANKTRLQIAKLDNQAKADIANINAQSKLDVATTNATAKENAAQTSANAKITSSKISAGAKNSAKANKPVTGATVQKAKQAALDAVYNTNTKKVRSKVTTDNSVQALVNNILRQYGIDPYSQQGTSIRKWVFSQINNRPSASGGIFKSGKDRLPK